jgi:gentisate 1,2-dioxygenase
MFNKVILDPSFGGPQSLYVHMKEMLPGTASQVHGHQNDALIYVLQGSGYDIQDGERIEWSAGDLVRVQPGVVHQHFCTSEEPARVLIIKAKPLYMFMNLLFQQLVKPASKDPVPGWEGYQPAP